MQELRRTLIFSLLVTTLCAAAETNWQRWRGPDNNGVMTSGNYPTTWDPENVLWKVEVPGKGTSTPIVWNNRIYLTTGASGADTLLALDWSGKELWQRQMGSEAKGKHQNASGSNPSPVTDGSAVFVFFKSGNLAAIELDGSIRWQTNLFGRYGKDQRFWDFGTSPVLTKSDVVMAHMHDGESWLAAFDKVTGEVRWKVPRNYKTPVEGRQGYTTPLVFSHEGTEALLVWGGHHLTAHDAANGKILWSCGNFNPDEKKLWGSVASPVIVGNVAVVPCGRDDKLQPRLHGIKMGGTGDVTATHRLWKRTDTGPFIPCPTYYKGRIYITCDRGRMDCIDPLTGESLWSGQFPKSSRKFYGSPLVAGGHLYAAREDGVIFVLGLNDKFEIISEIDMGDGIIASPIAIDDRLLIRTKKHLFCIESQFEDPPSDLLAPPNGPAEVLWDAKQGTLSLRYHGTHILKAKVMVKDHALIKGGFTMTQKDTLDDKVEQRFVIDLTDPQEGDELVLRGTVAGSAQAFPAETLSEAQERFLYVRNSVGLSRNLRNNAVYDRQWDWVLVGPGDGKTRIQPKIDENDKRAFTFECRGQSIELVFRPRYYQKHKDLEHFTPWTYPVWEGSLTGYCTWWSYRENFTQKTLDAMLALFTEKHLPDFGYDYMQFDNCFQPGNGSCPENWLNWDKKKYPGDWQYAIKAIRDAGMKPGIWVHRIHRPSDPHVADIAKAHPDWFVHKADGSFFMTHGFYVLDMTHEEAVDNMVRELYSGLKEQGWEYVKIDGTGDLLRAYQNKACEGFFETHATTPEQSLREWDIVAREELGPDIYVLACHTVGNAKHVIGLVDGGRLSNDGFQPRTLSQYNYMEGVVWRNDPDHCDVLGDWLMDVDAMMPVFGTDTPVPARSVIRPAICTMAGAALMLSDTLEVYQDDRNIEGMKRSAPVLLTSPGQLYSCERRPAPWWLQEIDRPFDHWSVLARIQWGVKEEDKHVYHFQGVSPEEVRFADLGLAADQEYLVYEFWDQTFLGKFKGSFTAPAMDKNTGMDVFAIREARTYPWILSTSRHISQGAISLMDERWDSETNVLSGQSAVVIDDPYVMTLHLPDGYRIETAEVEGEEVTVAHQQETATLRIVPSATGTVGWKVTCSEPASRIAVTDTEGVKADMRFFTHD
ncbi:MAG: PQQ-binding-like beta-propeller repeat protein [Planctomycetes bacterium]|nr:PQQ-binding-like beta-propeller repeat protein [Planctomycetota bacterium]